jgi:phosphoglycolate phosphatase
MRILLWDIDGTLISSGGAGIRALGDAVKVSEPASEALKRMRLDGMTDRKIARILCAAIRHRAAPDQEIEALQALVTAAEIDAVLTAYIARLTATLQGSKDYRVLPGVLEIMDAMGPGEAVHALGTGNIEEGARIKLEHGQIWQRFAFGGFGSDAEERSEIIRAAWHKAERHLNRTCAVTEFVVIGDTPKDISAAHAVGFACVAVATGRHSVHELAESGADLTVESLAQPGMVQKLRDVQRR